MLRSRSLPADPAQVWKLVGDPGKLARWWPNVDRIDRPATDAAVRWVISPRGRAVPMNYRIASGAAERSIVWSQQIVGSPFARSLKASTESFQVGPDPVGSLVTLELDRRLRGTAKLGWPFMLRGQRRELDRALDALEERFNG